MPKIDKTPCPACGSSTLAIQDKLVAKPLGTSSLAGAQLKVSAYRVPFISCTTCEWELEGRYTSDNYAIFDVNPEDPWSSVTPEMKEVPE